jgi:nucleolar protein 6
MGEALTKKQRKALEFRLSKEEKEKRAAEAAATEAAATEAAATEAAATAPAKRPLDDSADASAPKKRKTRRGKKGKGVNGGTGPRFLLFVGNLPYDVTADELLAHFKSSKPDRVRIRPDKGIAFLEFDNDTPEIQSKMELALRLHHSTLKQRKINVELTVGGGGNSDNRKTKLREKNDKLLDERRTRIREEVAKGRKREAQPGVHPSRANLVAK